MVYVSVAGGGPRGTYLAGTAAAVDKLLPVSGWSGASVGALIAALKAFGVSDASMLKAFQKFLDGRFVALGGPDSWARGGVLKWSAIDEACDEVLGHTAALGDARTALVVGVTDLDSGKPFYLSKDAHPKVLVKHALRASCAFMGGATPACAIPTLGSRMSPDIRLFADGGYTDNTVDHVFDHKIEPRVLLKLAPNELKRVRFGDVAAIHGAVFNALFYAQGLPKSRRSDGLVIEVPAAGGWEFNKTADRVNEEYKTGYSSGMAHAAQLIGL